MKLTKTERWMLANQMKILAKLYPENKDLFESRQEALEMGYEAEYETMTMFIVDGDEIVTDEECSFVLNILSMYRAIYDSANKLKPEERATLKENWVKFPGFDGNNEAKFLGYANHLADGGKFRELQVDGHIINSHMRTLHAYGAMLQRWDGAGNPHLMSIEQLNQLLP